MRLHTCVNSLVGLIKAAKLNLRSLDFLNSVIRSDHEVDGRNELDPFLRLAFRPAATAAYDDTSGYDSRCHAAPSLAKAGPPHS